MNPLKPLNVFTDAITFPLFAIFVIGVTGMVNWMVSPGVWWFKWAAFGMVIAVLCVWARALKALVLAIGVAGIAAFLYQAWRKKSPSN